MSVLVWMRLIAAALYVLLMFVRVVAAIAATVHGMH